MPCPPAIRTYRDATVIAAFCAHWDIAPADADAVFEDLMAWLWAASRPGAPALGITPPMQIVDEMWHEFVLHTERYAAWCEAQLGGFVHHRPDPPAGAPLAAEEVQAQWRFLAAELGTGRLLRWYVELPRRFDAAWFRTARRPRACDYQPTPALIARWDAWRRAHAEAGDA